MKNLLYPFVGLIVLVGISLITRLYKALPQHRRSRAILPSQLGSGSTSKAPSNDGGSANGSRSEHGGLRSRSGQGRMPGATARCTATIFLGSGGHTAEMLQLMSGLDPTKYTPRHYVVGWDDESSVEKVHRLEASRKQKDITELFKKSGKGVSLNQEAQSQVQGYTVHRIPRSRHVHQSLVTTPFTLAKSLMVAMPLIKQLTCLVSPQDDDNEPRKSVLLMNGPGTCFALALSVIGSRILGVPDELTPDLVFIESFARVKTLSLAGKLLYPLCDMFLVQWPGLVETYPRAQYIGML